MPSVLELIRHYQHGIEKYPQDEQRVLRYIDKLFSLDVTVAHLQETGVGRTVNALRKEPGDVGKAARALVYKWKLMVAAEESDQEGDYESKASIVHSYGKDLQERRSKPSESNMAPISQPVATQDHPQTNGNLIGTKRKHIVNEEEPEVKKPRSSHSSDDGHHNRKQVKSVRHESSSQDSSGSQSSSESSSGSDSEQDNKDNIKSHTLSNIKTEPHDHIIKQEDQKSKHSHHSRSDHKDIKTSHEKHSKHNIQETRHSSDKKEHQHSSKDRSSKEGETSSQKHKDHEEKTQRNKARSPSKDKKHREEKTAKHSSEKHSSNAQKAEKIDSGSEKNRSDKKSQKHSSSHRSDKEKHRSSESDVPSEKHKSKESTSSKESKAKESTGSKEHKSKDSSSSSKHKSSSSKEKSKEKSSSSKDASRHSDKSEKKSSSDKTKSDSKGKEKDEKSGEKKSSHKSKSSSSHKSSSSQSKDKPKKKVSTGDSDDGIGCESGASFAEALGMMSPAKSKKKAVPVKDSYLQPSSTNNINDLSPAALLAPSTKLAPLPALEISALPEISPNYKPRPPPKLLPHFDDDAMNAVISSKNQRTKVYSGNKVLGKIPSLYDLCVQVLQEHIDALEFTGGVPYEILKPVIDRATPQQLFMLEHFNPYLIEDTDHLWQKHVEKHFRNKKREEMETWRDMYLRCQEEQEYKLKSLTENIKLTQEAKKAPIKQTKMAYVDSVVKPPRNIARKQALHGTKFAAAASPAARVASLASAPNVLRGSVRPSLAAPSTQAAFSRPKKAPLMQKALQFMRGRKR